MVWVLSCTVLMIGGVQPRLMTLSISDYFMHGVQRCFRVRLMRGRQRHEVFLVTTDSSALYLITVEYSSMLHWQERNQVSTSMKSYFAPPPISHRK